MKSLLLAGSYAPSLINFRGPLIAALVEVGWRVVATAPDIDDGTAERVRALGAEPIPVPMSRTGLDPRADIAYAGELAKLIRKQRIDALLTYTIKPNIWGAFASNRAKVPSVAMVTGLGYAFTDDGEQSEGLKRRIVGLLARFLYRRATNRSARVIFQNQDDVDDFAAAGCLSDRSKVRLVAGSGVDLDHYAPAPLPEAPRFLMISRLLKNKGVREYGEAAIRLKREMPNATFDLVGYRDDGPDGVSPADIDRWVACGVTYHGPQADVRPFIAASSVYALPSYREGTPRSSLEAMAMGRPIVTSDAPGCRETVPAGRNGFLTPVRDVEALVDAMRRLALDGAMRQDMGAASLDLARERFNVHKVNAAIIATLDEVL